MISNFLICFVVFRLINKKIEGFKNILFIGFLLFAINEVSSYLFIDNIPFFGLYYRFNQIQLNNSYSDNLQETLTLFRIGRDTALSLSGLIGATIFIVIQKIKNATNSPYKK